MARAQIGTCSGPADAALVRAALEAHDIHVVINAEQHASMLGGLGGAFVPLHIFVDDLDAEQASALLADLRERDDSIGAPEVGEPEHADDDESEAEASLKGRADRRRRIGIMLVIGLAMAFTTPYVIGRPVLAVVLVLGGLAAMFATMSAAKPKPPQIPRARIRR